MEQFILNTIQPIVVALITAMIPLVLAAVGRYFYKKTGIEVSNDLMERANAAATHAVLAVEEKAAGAMAKGAVEWTSGQKRLTAVGMIMSMVPSVTPEQADSLVHAALAKIPALGASGDVTIVKP